MNWRGLTCVVTGASSGFGRAACKSFAGKGATVIAVARREDKLKSLVDELGGAPHSYRVCDVSSLEDIRALAAWIDKDQTRVDILLNNAGVATSGPLGQTTSEEMEKVIRTNLLGPMWCAKELTPAIDRSPRTARTPVIVNVASMAGRIPTPGSPDYSASKFGLVAFTEAVWQELQSRGIRTMMVNPGLTDTEGFPMDMIRANRAMSWTVMETPRVIRALVHGIERGAFEVRVQWWMHPLYHLSVLMGPLRRIVSGRMRQKMGDTGRL